MWKYKKKVYNLCDSEADMTIPFGGWRIYPEFFFAHPFFRRRSFSDFHPRLQGPA